MPSAERPGTPRKQNMSVPDVVWRFLNTLLPSICATFFLLARPRVRVMCLEHHCQKRICVCQSVR